MIFYQIDGDINYFQNEADHPEDCICCFKSEMNEISLQEEPIDLTTREENYMNVDSLDEESIDVIEEIIDVDEETIDMNEEPIDLTIKRDDQECIDCIVLPSYGDPIYRHSRNCRRVEALKRALTFDDDDCYPLGKIRKINLKASERPDVGENQDPISFNNDDADKTGSSTESVDESQVYSDDEMELESVKSDLKFIPSPSEEARMAFIDEESDQNTFFCNKNASPDIEYKKSCSNTEVSFESDKATNNSLLRMLSENGDNFAGSNESWKISEDQSRPRKYIYKIGKEDRGIPLSEENLDPRVCLNLRENQLLYNGRIIQGLEVKSYPDNSPKDDSSDDSSVDSEALFINHIMERKFIDFATSTSPPESAAFNYLEVSSGMPCTNIPEIYAMDYYRLILEGQEQNEPYPFSEPEGFSNIERQRITRDIFNNGPSLFSSQNTTDEMEEAEEVVEVQQQATHCC